MPSYEEMLDYILDNGLECSCCMCGGWCRGITPGPNGPMFPPCSSKDFNDLLDEEQVVDTYKEAHAND